MSCCGAIPAQKGRWAGAGSQRSALSTQTTGLTACRRRSGGKGQEGEEGVRDSSLQAAAYEIDGWAEGLLLSLHITTNISNHYCFRSRHAVRVLAPKRPTDTSAFKRLITAEETISTHRPDLAHCFGIQRFCGCSIAALITIKDAWASNEIASTHTRYFWA